MVIKTFKATVEATVQAETEQEASATLANLLNSPKATSPNTGGFINSSARVAGINKIEFEEVSPKEERDDEETKAEKEQQEKEEKLIDEQLKDIPKGAEIPDEIVIRDPDTGVSKLVKNPKKEEMEKERKEGGGKKQKTTATSTVAAEEGEDEKDKDKDKETTQQSRKSGTRHYSY